MRRILFVDDEQSVLDGLQNLLRRQRKVWDMCFANGAEAALAEMARAPVDIVVSDMRMPGMDGAALLHVVRMHHPRTARFILSGQADRESVIRALPVAQQFLSKPCDPEELRQAIERVCSLQDLVGDPSIQTLVGKIDRLPSSPDVYWELTQAARRSDVKEVELARIVERDAALSVMVLHLVNSAFFGAPQHILSIREALGVLGTELVRGLALSAHAFSLARSTEHLDATFLEGLQAHSLQVATLVRKIVSPNVKAEEAFTAAMVHDVGQIVLAHAMPERFARVRQECQRSRRPFHEVEADVLGVSHAVVGAYLLGIWGLPIPLVEAAAYHHTPGRVHAGNRELLAAVHFAEAVLSGLGPEGHAEEPLPLDRDFLEAAGLSPELPRWHHIAEAVVANRPRAREDAPQGAPSPAGGCP